MILFYNSTYLAPRITPLLAAVCEIANLVGIQNPIDRTALFADELDVRKLTPSAVPFTGSFAEVMALGAERLNAMQGEKVVMWSGGLDSTGVLCALLASGRIKDYQILLTQESVAEYPEFFAKHIQPNAHRIMPSEGSWTEALLSSLPAITITGHGHSIPNYVVHRFADSTLPLDSDWHAVLDLLKNPAAKEMLMAHVVAAPMLIRSVDDVYWLIRFVFAKHQTTYRMGCVTERSEDGEKFVPFYGSDLYESWEVANRDRMRVNRATDRAKNDLRAFIFALTKDAAYTENKRQENSPARAFGSANIIYKRKVLFDNFKESE